MLCMNREEVDYNIQMATVNLYAHLEFTYLASIIYIFIRSKKPQHDTN